MTGEGQHASGDADDDAVLAGLFADYPEALQPVCGWPRLNEDVVLYEGDASVQLVRNWVTGRAVAKLSWFPTPRLEVEVEFDPVAESLDFRSLGELDPNQSLRFRIGDCEGEGRPALFNAYEPSVRIVVRTFERRWTTALHLRFDLVNLSRVYGTPITNGRGISNSRLTLDGGGWNLVLDGRTFDIDRASERDPDSGYLITHTGRATKHDGTSISPDDARSFLTMLQYALSIPENRWVTPICIEGRTGDDSVAWTIWDLWNMQPWSKPLNWFPALYTLECQQEFFERLASRWYESRESEQLLRTATHYYLDAHSHGLLNRGLIMGFALVELVAWELVMDGRSNSAPQGFDQDLAKKLRKLLTRHDVPITIPSALAALRNLAKEKEWGDGPKALAEIRHTAVHAKRHRDGWQWSQDLWIDALRLCEWYTDLSMLALVGYEGRYLDRLTATSDAEWGWVPWSTRITDGPRHRKAERPSS